MNAYTRPCRRCQGEDPLMLLKILGATTVRELEELHIMKTSRPRRLLHYLCIAGAALCTCDQSDDQQQQQHAQAAEVYRARWQHRHHEPRQRQYLLQHFFAPQPPQQQPDSGPIKDERRAPMVDYELLDYLLEEGRKCSCSQSRLLPHFGAIATTSVAILGHSAKVGKAKAGETITGFGRLSKSPHPKAMKGVSSVIKGNEITMNRGKGDGLAGLRAGPFNNCRAQPTMRRSIPCSHKSVCEPVVRVRRRDRQVARHIDDSQRSKRSDQCGARRPRSRVLAQWLGRTTSTTMGIFRTL